LTVFCTQDSATDALVPVGVYCCEREALDCVRPTGYQDLKEQWVPALQEAGMRVGAVVLRGATREILSWSNYVQVLEQSLLAEGVAAEGFGEPAPGIWCGQRVRVSPTARLVGPVVLGHECAVEDDAVVLGPTILGDGSRVGRDAWVSRLIAPGRVEVPEGATVVDRLMQTIERVSSPRALELCRRSGLALRITAEELRSAGARDSMTLARNGARSST
jgi:NDP-sugar pyrophosphorylase family protein